MSHHGIALQFNDWDFLNVLIKLICRDTTFKLVKFECRIIEGDSSGTLLTCLQILLERSHLRKKQDLHLSTLVA